MADDFSTGMGNMGMMGFMYPQLMGPQRQMAYGQALLGQAADASAVRSPWQAVARAFSGALGGYEMSQGQQAGVAAMQAQQEASNRAVNEALYGPGGGGTQPSAPPTAAQPTAQPAADSETTVHNIMMRESGGRNIPTTIMGPDARTPASTASGYWQMLDSTWKEAAQLAGIDTTNLPRAMDASYDQQHAAAMALFNKKGEQPWAASAPPGATLAPPPGQSGQPPPVLVAASNTTLGPPQNTQDLAMRYERAAMALSGSINPQDRMRAQMFMQQAQFYRQQGAWGDPMQIQPGIFAQRNGFTGEVKIQGRPTPVEKDANGNLVRTSDGSIVSATHGYHATGNVSPDGRSMEIIGPDGKPEWIQQPQITEATQQQQDYQTLQSLSDKMTKGTASAPERAAYANAYTRIGAPEWKDVNGVMTQVPSTKLPPNIYQPPGAAASAVPPGVQPSSGSAPTSVGVPTALLSGQQEQSAKDVSAAAAELSKSTDDMNRTRGDIQLIRSNLPNVATGLGTTNVTLPASEIIARLGYSPDQVRSITGVDPVAGELTAKNLFDLFARRVQEQGGVRAQSIFKMFERALPSLESRPETIDTLTRVYDAALAYEQKYDQDKYTFLNNQRMKFLGSGKPTDYQGIGTFDTDWSKANDMRTWMAAAEAAGQSPTSVWNKDLQPGQTKVALDLVRQLWPGRQVYGPSGLMSPPSS